MQIIGSSDGINHVRANVRRLARARKNTVICGEVRVGKELVAETIRLESVDAKSGACV
ncbi:MAG: sigma 54-interacting transcriptional regulator [Ignavibacteria bacterium]|nr:sigma 54-interacting transcriptional regulator [Ignavibacteria bacterium]